jgi:ribosomal protein S18 acetylase RimI-like enzyme
MFQSFAALLGPIIYGLIWPDWRQDQAKAFEAVLQDRDKTVLVAECEGTAVGFIACMLDQDAAVGDIVLLAVHPDYQERGIGTALTRRATEQMREAGMKLARVETGGDPAHAPARATYENAGYAPLPLVRYFQAL